MKKKCWRIVATSVIRQGGMDQAQDSGESQEGGGHRVQPMNMYSASISQVKA